MDAGDTTVASASKTEKEKRTHLVGLHADVINSTHVHAAEPLSQIVEYKFSFKQPKADEVGERPAKRPAVELHYHIPTAAGLLAALADPKQLQYVLDLIADDVYTAGVRAQLDANTNLTQETLDQSKLTIEALANIPKNDRRGGGIAKEVWEDFKKDYEEVMPSVTGQEKKAVEMASDIFFKKFQPVKTNKKIVEKLQIRLSTWFANSPKAEEFKECFEFLNNKATELLAVDENAILEAL